MSIPNYSSYSDPNMPGAFPNDGMMPPSGKNTMAVVALVLAIIGLVTCWVAILGFLLSIIGVILSIIALVISVIGVLVGLFVTISMVYVASVASECFTIADPTAKAQCVQEKLETVTK